MRRISKGVPTVLLGLAVTVGFPVPLHSQTSTQDESAIQQVLSGMDEAWNQGDAKALANYFTPEAELIDVAGTIHGGRNAIERRDAILLGDMLNGSHLTQELRTIKFLRPDVAVVDANAQLYGYKSVPKGLPTSGAVLTARVRHVMVYNGKWWIVATQFTYVPPPPPPE
jgi:uncharacterized protein (TIGR02246 family)